MSLIDEALEIFSRNGPGSERKSKVAPTLTSDINWSADFGPIFQQRATS